MTNSDGSFDIASKPQAMSRDRVQVTAVKICAVLTSVATVRAEETRQPTTHSWQSLPDTQQGTGASSTQVILREYSRTVTLSLSLSLARDSVKRLHTTTDQSMRAQVLE
jgi:hypothetical protein